MTISLPLRIRYSPQNRLSPVAWYFPTGNPNTWLAELTTWGLPFRDLSLVPVDPSGVLVIIAGGQTLARPTCAIPMGCVAKFYLPTNASFTCEITATEATALRPPGISLSVFLPDGRIIGVSEDEILSVKDLLTCGTATESDWGGADPGDAYNERLLTILPLNPPTLQAVLDAGHDNIGTRPFEETPPSPHEPSNTLWDQAGRSVRKAAANVAKWLAKQIQGDSASAARGAGSRSAKPSQPRTAGTSLLATLAESLQQWSEKVTRTINQNLDEIRHRELLRLLEMLKTNPDEGLKFAIPIGGEAARGSATPGGRLLQRSTDFTLSGGGGPADVWDIAEQYQQRLRTHYRELANRELNLGRFRRAAYVLSHLLGDFIGAAAALEAGGHWREAAVLFAEKLNQPRAAADCLLRGGLVQEALERFETLGLHEIVGDLYVRLEQPAEARAAWLRAAAGHTVAYDLLESARIHETKLNDVETALQVLNSGWDSNIVPGKCLNRTFEILARSGKHEIALQRLGLLLQEPADNERNLLAAETVANVLSNYSDANVCRMGVDFVRVLAARYLRLSGNVSQRRWISVLKTVGSNDKLIARDGERFLTTFIHSTPPIPPRTAKPKSALKVAQHILTIATLPKNVVWKAVAVGDDEFYFAGIQNRTLQLWRGDLTGSIQQGTPDRIVAATDEIEVQIAVPPNSSAPVLVATSHDVYNVNWSFPEFGSNFRPMKGILANSATGRLVGCCYAVSAQYMFFREADRIWGNAYQVPGSATKLTGTFELISTDVESDTHFLPLMGQRSILAIAQGKELHIAIHPEQRQTLEIAELIRRIAASQPFSRFRLAVATANGGFYFSAAGGFRLDSPSRFGDEISCPEICFTSLGHLIVVAQQGGEIYSTANNEFRLSGLIPRLSTPPVAVMPGKMPGQFAVMLTSGAIEIFSVP